jgi:hypothetical protein
MGEIIKYGLRNIKIQDYSLLYSSELIFSIQMLKNVVLYLKFF